MIQLYQTRFLFKVIKKDDNGNLLSYGTLKINHFPFNTKSSYLYSLDNPNLLIPPFIQFYKTNPSYQVLFKASMR
ncbi:hypothetical protein HanRHA438_Chr00c76g0862771 [Helianthus annuus]|nr:hypothetical protein HanRHA438_Chr00c76g0862771 [Helianthus annuus]